MLYLCSVQPPAGSPEAWAAVHCWLHQSPLGAAQVGDGSICAVEQLHCHCWKPQRPEVVAATVEAADVDLAEERLESSRSSRSAGRRTPFLAVRQSVRLPTPCSWALHPCYWAPQPAHTNLVISRLLFHNILLSFHCEAESDTSGHQHNRHVERGRVCSKSSAR